MRGLHPAVIEAVVWTWSDADDVEVVRQVFVIFIFSAKTEGSKALFPLHHAPYQFGNRLRLFAGQNVELVGVSDKTVRKVFCFTIGIAENGIANQCVIIFCSSGL